MQKLAKRTTAHDGDGDGDGDGKSSAHVERDQASSMIHRTC